MRRGRDNCLFVNAVLYRVRTGVAWRDLPERFGPWNTVAWRFRHWAQAGVWEALYQAVHEPDYAWVLVNSTTVKAHKAAAEGFGRSWGGFSTKLHAVLDALGNCLHLVLTPGHWVDYTQLPALLAGLCHIPGAVVADNPYDPNAMLAALPFATPRQSLRPKPAVPSAAPTTKTSTPTAIRPNVSLGGSRKPAALPHVTTRRPFPA